MTPTRRSDHRMAILLVTVVSGLAGGLLAHLIWRNVEAGALLLILFAGSAIATVAAFSLLTGETQPGPREAGSPSSPPAPVQTGSAGPVLNSSTRSRPDTPGRVLLPLVEQSPVPVSGKRRWWAETSPNSGGRTATPPAPAPSLANYEAHRALIAQCPQCGDFRIDVSSAGSSYSFRCRNPRCANTWTWTPGSPWPAVVVRRNLTGG